MNNQDYLILDGATGTEISRMGGKIDNVSWSAIANITHPNLVRSIHEKYLKIGVDVITTNTFSSCRHVLEGSNLGNQTKKINQTAVRLAKEACYNVAPSKNILIAGSMSNTLAWKKGKAYPDPSYIPDIQTETNNYREMAYILADSGIDIFILEMMLDTEHSCRLLEVVKEIGLPVWVGLSCSEKINGEIVGYDLSIEREEGIDQDYLKPINETLEKIFKALKNFDPDVLGIMHSNIKVTYKVVEYLSNHWSNQIMAYPEIIYYDYSKHEYNSLVSPSKFAHICKDWLDMGVDIIGGCCGTTPNHINELIKLINLHD
ncbi:MAG: Bifunctional homocysteine S-methyltransferase/5,10-methylenetetrahydrofolate reductase [Alphaproteobacteria bacterium MarineAlpha2_Bin1]|nr:MAG: Bifunctional homocysteine S-methyltransferase/5,10-methylenetetrahydrofolate reductase [Alphaproteobacteria bacterium MarineAlpha2_Bin1]